MDDKTIRKTSPSTISFDTEDEKVLLAQANGNFNVAYTEHGKLYSWGENSTGQLGTGNYENQFKPTNITDKVKISKDETFI